MMLRRAFLSLAPAALMRAQDATFSTEVKVVNVLTAVRTKKGDIVRDLTKSDFSIAENGRPQNIRYFTRQSDLPLTIGLMIDTSVSQQKVIEAERVASFRFIDQVLREDKDQVFIMQFDTSVQLRQRLTNSRRSLDEVLPYVDTETRKQLIAQGGGSTLLYDAVLKASNEVMKTRTGRKAMIVLSDGEDTGSEATITQAIEAAQRADTLIYSIFFSGGGSGQKVLMRMSKETGGGFFEVTKKISLEQIFAILEDELRSQYNIGYVSDQPVVISEFRKLQLTTARKDLVVQARDRYWAQR
ncbi:MAG: von Willebrand factor, type [Bryobacterales bacterium]|nr:von Willebrand factor, type [Bryobacterales bacterium]